MTKPVLIFGATERGKVAADIFKKNEITIYGFLDDTPAKQGQVIYELPVVGSTEDPTMLALLDTECWAFLALENLNEYNRVWQMLCGKYSTVILANAIHPQAVLPTHVRLGEGLCIEAGAQLGPEAFVSSHCWLAPNVVLGSEVVVHDFVHIGAGTVVGKQVLIEEGARIGAGAVIKAKVKIGAGAYVPAGAIITQDQDVLAHSVHEEEDHLL